jgi:hypothetical protein
VGHGEVARDVQGSGEGEDEGGGGAAQGGGAGAQVPPPVYSVSGGKLNTKLWIQELEVRGTSNTVVDGKYVKLRGGRRGPLSRVGTHRPRCEGRAGRGPDQGGGRRELLGRPGETVEEAQPHPGRSRRGEGPGRGHLPFWDPGREADLPAPPQTKDGQEGE